MQRLLLICAGLVGAVGVASAAAASHQAEARNMIALAAICLSHGPALLAIGLAGATRPVRMAGVLMAIGTIIFGADIALRQWGGHALFPGAAPFGGGAMILSWLGLALCGAFAPMQKFKID